MGFPLDFFQELIEHLVSWWQIFLNFVSQDTGYDSSVWAIGFTVNTWPLYFDRAQFQAHGLIRKAIDESRAKAQQAHLLEQLAAWPVQDLKQTRRFLKEYASVREELDRLARQYPTSRESETHHIPILGFPRFVLNCFAVFSIWCLLARWFNKFTLLVLIPYPCFQLYYKYFRSLLLPRHIQRRFKKLMDMFPEMEANIRKEKQQVDKALRDLTERFKISENTAGN